MPFNSLRFAAFFPIVTAAFFLSPTQWRWALLLAASAYFYMDFIPGYILILAALIVVDFAAALWMDPEEGWRRRAILTASLLSNLAMLAIFKYYGFACANLGRLAAWLHVPWRPAAFSLALPIGLSFHTVQSMSYTLEVYRKNQRPQRHLGVYALYVMFYPQLVAGPIERPQHLLPQLSAPTTPDAAAVQDGLRVMLLGFFKKVAVADTLALLVNSVYRSPASFSSASILLAAYAFAFQILYDFSGYSDIARGAAKVMGYELMINFDRPYAARSLSEFWRRWHISLSTWFRDYLYIPLGGNRAGLIKRSRNLMIVFLTSGLWHGANWTFVVWGAVHGAALILTEAVSSFWRKVRKAASPSRPSRIGTTLSVLATFHFSAFAWILFRAKDLSQAAYILRRLGESYDWSAARREVGLELVGACALLVAAAEAYEWFHAHGGLKRMLPHGGLLRQSVAYALAFASIAVIAIRLTYDATPQQFIYFQF